MYIKNSPISKFKHPQPEKNFCIYCLIDPISNSPKYIGLTTNGYTRISSHYNKGTRENTRKVNWIKKLKSLNLCFVVQYLEYCETEDQLRIAEKKWIKYYRESLGADLLNHTEGGDAVYRPEYTEQQKKAISDRNKVIFGTDAVRQKMRQLAKGNTYRRGKRYTKEQLDLITKRNRETSGVKIKDQFGNVYPSISYLAHQINCSPNTIKDRLRKKSKNPIKGLILEKVLCG